MTTAQKDEYEKQFPSSDLRDTFKALLRTQTRRKGKLRTPRTDQEKASLWEEATDGSDTTQWSQGCIFLRAGGKDFAVKATPNAIF